MPYDNYLPSYAINVEGQELTSGSVLEVSIDLKLYEHSRFEIQVYGDSGDSSSLFTESRSHELLGKEVSLSFTYSGGSGNKQRLFKGVFTDVRHSNPPSDFGLVLLTLSGYGKTILLDGGPTNNSYLDVTVTDVVQKVLRNAGLDGVVNPSYTSKIPYITQYGETDFEFLRRLAAEFGDSFYYDGTKIHFGKMDKKEAFELSLGQNIISYALQVKMQAANSTQFAFFSKTDKLEEENNRSFTPPGLDLYGKAALSKSTSFFQSTSRLLSPRKAPDAAGVKHAVKVAKQRVAGGLTTVNIEIDDPYINIGSTIKVSTSAKSENSYIVIGSHLILTNGAYANHLEAVPENLEVLPNPYFRKPLAEPQVGKVVVNKDPDNLGRVQVRLMWQNPPENTPFIRVLRPDGGGSAKNRGFYFIPEIDDLVMVGFAQNDPDRPFVMGALPTGKVSDNAKYGKNNDFRSISTRSGSIISFEDTDSDNEIRVELDAGNYISIQKKSSDGTIKIFSSKAIEVESKETVNVKSKTITIEATDSITMKANKKIEIKAADIAIEASKGLEAKGGATAKIQGAQTEISGSAKTTVKGGAQLELQGGGIASLKGAIVQIN